MSIHRTTGRPEFKNDLGDHFGMVDYHVLSMENVGGLVTDHGVALGINAVLGRTTIVGSGCGL
ncbi:MAG: hypothetical protein R2806_09155 [Saprospiraceae bacterium]